MRLDTYPDAATHARGYVRRHSRSLFSVPLTIYRFMAGGIPPLHGISLDISEGGLGALVQGDLNVGQTVEIDFRLPERMLSALAIVRHTSSVRSGFEFVGLSAEEQLQIRSAAASS